MAQGYVLQKGDTPAMVASGFCGDAGRASELLGVNPQLGRVVRRDRAGRVVRTFDTRLWREGATVRIPSHWVSPVIAGQVGAGGDKDLWGSCGKDSDCSGNLVCRNGQCDNPGGGGGGGNESLMTGEQGAPCDIGSDCKTGLRCDPATHTCQPGASDFLGPCNSDAAIRQVQAAIGADVDGDWGPLSQAALNATGKSFKDFLNCQGDPPTYTLPGPGPGPITPACKADGGACAADADCCSGLSCQNGKCGAPVQAAKGSSWGWIVAILAAGAGAVGLAYASSSKKGHRAAQANPIGRMTKQDALRNFRENILPHVIARYGRDKPAIREAWNNYTDGLQKDGLITASQYHNWVGPF